MTSGLTDDKPHTAVRRYGTWIGLCLGLGLSGVLLAFAVRGTSRATLALALEKVNWAWALPFLAALLMFYWLKAVRWGYLLAPIAATRGRELFPSVMIGYAANSVAPAQLGELVRALIGARLLNLRFSTALGTVVVERLFDFSVVLLLLAAGLGLGAALPANLQIFARGTSVLLLLGIGAIVWLTLAVRARASLVQCLAIVPPRRFGQFLARQADAGFGGLTVVRSGRAAFGLLLLSVVKWGCMAACVWLSLRAAQIDVTLATTLLLVALTVLGVSLPSAPGYIGTIQAAYVLALGPAGIDSSTALAASMFYHLLAYVTVVVMGFYYLHRSGYRLRELRAAAAGQPTGAAACGASGASE